MRLTAEEYQSESLQDEPWAATTLTVKEMTPEQLP